ncbi:DNA polymerase III subunit beta [Nocardia brasiliensis]|uniref:DNA polymerase III subunit beta n=1 Tax=Nocardia brasiliensis TaxID=37326 RepID=A0A6G9Y149_NOCBR|nr:DNA polymerase III subunit beta [Nocardia brasiliensis]QIS06797.1 DNA polymerase III subunit beta [Nocardia brasiliensis]
MRFHDDAGITMMQAVVEHKAFAAAVAAVSKAVPERPIAPEHGGIVLSADQNKLTLSACDLETSLLSRLEAQVLRPGDTLVSGRLLARLTKELPRTEIHLGLSARVLAIEAGASVFGLPTMASTTYPALPTPAAATATVDGERFAEAVTRACGALTGGDAAALKSLFGIRLEASEGRLAVVATDRWRMAITYLEWDAADARTLLPADSLAAIVRTADGVDPTLHFGTTFGLSTASMMGTTRSLAHDYPTWQRVLAYPHAAMVSMPSADLVAALRRVEVVAGKTAHVTLTTASDGFTVTVTDTGEATGSARELVHCQSIGTPITTRCNAAFLRSMVVGLKSDSVTLGFSDPADRRPLLAYPGDHARSLEKPSVPALCAVMPVR